MLNFPLRNKSGIRIGVDIVEVKRVVRLITENPDILDTIFTTHESAYCVGKRGQYERLAVRFAAKEAVLKAFGTGIGQGVYWTDVEVINDVIGKPHICLHNEVAASAQRRGLVDLDITLSHTVGMAIACAVAVWK
ncbi:holo-ACP synthase [Nostocaceae cyanobacterium CENA357]|uniref:Holo-[acyl-carrier-protein] synthase n=1 Tax=Atlanticothrix silvestris CENA357 TaxID=1725252 RepID=A0A8J7HMY8_9CYAN|nr:holo-ACP synthase [Atlanticothrix silvestris]MBH8556144.1 holo-ACP synthase [Atlanticothrix silvestris CENA357]